MEDREFIEEVAEAVIVPPDGGWGWVIVLASFFCNMIVDGIIFTAGSGFQRSWEHYYGVNSGTSAWAVSLLSGCYLCVGPVVSVLANIFGSRKVVMFGTVLAATGFVLSMFAPSVNILFFTFGIIGGIGFGLVYMPSIVMVSHYFQRRRALATGIAVCGSGIGTFAFAPLITYLNQEFTWQNVLLIMTGITLNILVFGSLYRELEPSTTMIKSLERKYEQEKVKALSEEDLNRRALSAEAINSTEVTPRRRSSTKQVAFNDSDRLEENGRDSLTLDVPGMQGHKEVSRLRSDTPRSLHHRHHYNSRTFTDTTGRQRHYSLFSINEAKDESFGLLRGAPSRENIKKFNRPLSRGDIFYTGSVQHLPQYKSQGNVSRYVASVTNLDEVMVLEEGDDMTAITHSFKATLLGLLDYALLKSPTFLVLCLSGFLTLSGFFVPFIYLPRYAESVGHPESQATFLVSLLGITNIFARILCGWLSDHPRMDALTINNVALTIGGLLTILVPHMQPYWLLCLYCVAFGFSTACFASLRSVICVELLGLERLNNAFGLMLMFLGLASLIGAPLAGTLRDLTGDFKLSFYVCGSLVTLSGIVGFPLHRVSRWERGDEVLEPEMEEPDDVQMIEVTIPEEEEQIEANIDRL